LDPEDRIAELPARPCCLRPEYSGNSDWLRSAGGENWEERFDRNDWYPYQGTITIVDQGCTFYGVLILNGEFTGRICNIDLDLEPPVFAPHGNFLEWYEGWLNEVLCGNPILSS
jgi:hypothetical protein